MKKVICVTFAAVALFLATTLPVYAAGRIGGRPGIRGHPEVRAQHESRGHPGSRERHEGFRHGDFHRHHDTDVFIGSGFWWVPPDWWGPAYPYYAEPPVTVQQEPPVYIQPDNQPQSYWYYCPNPSGYYPYIQQCPGGWLTVVPSTSPPPQ